MWWGAVGSGGVPKAQGGRVAEVPAWGRTPPMYCIGHATWHAPVVVLVVVGGGGVVIKIRHAHTTVECSSHYQR